MDLADPLRVPTSTVEQHAHTVGPSSGWTGIAVGDLQSATQNSESGGSRRCFILAHVDEETRSKRHRFNTCWSPEEVIYSEEHLGFFSTAGFRFPAVGPRQVTLFRARSEDHQDVG